MASGEGTTVQGPMPVLLAMLICEQVITDKDTNKKSLIGIFDRLHVPEFPMLFPMTVFARIADARGKYPMKLELAHLQDDKVVGESSGFADVKDRTSTHDLLFNLSIVIPKEGIYEFRLYANNAYLGRAAFQAIHEKGEVK
jgi:hypothetical protein